jgi:secreted trypsin-like serine protease
MKASATLPLLFSILIAVVGLSTGCIRSTTPTDFQAQGPAKSTQLSGIIGGFIPGPDHAITKSVVLLYTRDPDEKDPKKAQDSSQGHCTATLLSTEYALTAAHCIENVKENSLFLAFGNKFSPQNPQRFVIAALSDRTRSEVLSKIPSTNAHDIAVLKFAGGLPPGYQPARILPDEYINNLKVGGVTTIAGFGIDNNEEGNVDTLRFTDVHIANPQLSPTDALLDQTKGRGACKGDSGGPAFFYIGGKFYLWGVASHGSDISGNPSDGCDRYVVYTNALYYRYAIKQLMIVLSSGPSSDFMSEMGL